MAKTTTSKSTSKSKSFYLSILLFLNSNYKLSMQDIADKLETSKQNIYFYTRTLRDLELLKKVGYGTWELTNKAHQILEKPEKDQLLQFIVDNYHQSKSDSSVGLKKRGFRGMSLINIHKKLEVHAIQIKIPIESGKIDFTQYGGWEQKDFNNWIPQYLEINQPFKIILRNNNNKSISVFLHADNIKDPSNISPMIHIAVSKIFEWFKDKSARLDILNWKVLNTDIAREDDVAQDKLKKGDKILQKFDKSRKKITDRDPIQQSKAWLDTSPNPSIETNDIDYMYAYLKMPFTIKEIAEMSRMLAKESIDTSQKFSVVADVLKANTEQMGALIKVMDTITPKKPEVQENTITDLNKIKYIG